MSSAGEPHDVLDVDDGPLHPQLGPVLASVIQRSHLLHPEDVPVLAEVGVAGLGGRDARIYVIDLEQRWLVPLEDGPGERGGALDVDATIAGRAFRDGRTVRLEDEWWVPLLDGVDRIGVLHLAAEDPDGVLVASLPPLATVLAHVIVSKSVYADRLQILRRERPLDLAAELRWAVVPPLTFRSREVRIAGILEPAYEIAGDTFDYAVDGGVARIVIADAMGHGLRASCAANLAIGAYRHARRTGATLLDTAAAMDAAIRAEYGTDLFVTGQLAELDLARGTLHWVNAGHPAPLRLRHGREVHPLTGDAYLPIGLGDVPTTVVRSALEPGDAVLFFTDGIVDARSPQGDRFGEERLAERLVTAWSGGLSVAETVRRLSLEVTDHQHGRATDDATLVLMVWDGSDRT